MTRESKTLNEALESLDIQSWLDREGVEYKETRGSSGVQLNVKCCPRCGNSNWKVYLNQETGLGNCFHGDCESKFNKWSFIRDTLDTLTSRQVFDHIVEVAKELGWRPRAVKAAPVVNTGALVLPKSYRIPQDLGGKNLKYLADRNVTPELAEYFYLRFCKSGYFAYELDGKELRQSYDNRIIIPIFDLNGNLCSFQGRDIVGAAEKKYIFPPGFASTGAHLYNGHHAWGKEHLVIGEGVFDAIAIKAALDEVSDTRDIGIVGTFGKHLSSGENSQLEKLLLLKERGLKTITFMWDGEEKAYEDAIRCALLARLHGFQTRVATLPKDRDPNEVAPSVVRDAFWKAQAITRLSAASMLISNPYR